MEELLCSLFLIMIETVTFVYFFDIFFSLKRNDILGRCRFFIYYIVNCCIVLIGTWIDIWKVLLFIFAFVLLSMLFYKATLRQMLFFSVLNYGFGWLIDFIVYQVYKIKNIEPPIDEAWDVIRYYLLPFAGKIVWLFLLVLFRKIWKQERGYESLTKIEWIELGSISFFTLTACVYMFFSNPSEKKVQSVYLFFTIGLIGINFIVFHLIQNILEKAGEIQLRMLAGQKQKNQLDAYQEMKEVYDSQRRKMHDYKNQLATIQTLINSKDIQTALTFTEKLTESISVEMSAVNTNHAVVNAVLNQKFHSAREKDISMIIKISDLHEFSMEEEEIVTLISNLLDNAIRECENVIKVKGKAVMHLKLIYEDEKLILSVKNPVIKKVDIKDCQGIGLFNVREIVKKYNGDMEMVCDEKEFKVVVMI